MVGVPAKQIGWVSENGDTLNLPVNGSANTKCKYTGQKYILEGDHVRVSN